MFHALQCPHKRQVLATMSHSRSSSTTLHECEARTRNTWLRAGSRALVSVRRERSTGVALVSAAPARCCFNDAKISDGGVVVLVHTRRHSPPTRRRRTTPYDRRLTQLTKPRNKFFTDNMEIQRKSSTFEHIYIKASYFDINMILRLKLLGTELWFYFCSKFEFMYQKPNPGLSLRTYNTHIILLALFTKDKIFFNTAQRGIFKEIESK